MPGEEPVEKGLAQGRGKEAGACPAGRAQRAREGQGQRGWASRRQAFGSPWEELAGEGLRAEQEPGVVRIRV